MTMVKISTSPLSSPETPTESSPIEAPNLPTVAWKTVDLEFAGSIAAPPPAFPSDILGPFLKGLIQGFSEARQIAVDYVAMAIIAAISGAIGNRLRIRNFDGTAQVLALYVMLVGAPSTGKSQAIRIVEEPLGVIDDEITFGIDQRVATKSRKAGLDHKTLLKVGKNLLFEIDGKDTEQYRRTARLLLTETTGAGLIDELSGDAAGRLLLSHEIVGSLPSGGTTGGVHPRTLILSGYDGHRYVKRTKTEGVVIIDALLISILGAVQPDRLRHLAGNAHDGLVARALWVHPDAEPLTRLAISPGPTEDLRQLLLRLAHLPAPTASTAYYHLIPMGEDVRVVLETAMRRWAAIQKVADGFYRDVLGRAGQHAMRLAGVMRVGEHVGSGTPGLPTQIDADDVSRAVHLVDAYLLPMAERTIGVARAPEATPAAQLARYLCRIGKPTFNVRADVLRGGGSPMRDPQTIELALAELEERGVIRQVGRDPARRGRPALAYQVHPDLSALIER